jgi:hypothetical protein
MDIKQANRVSKLLFEFNKMNPDKFVLETIAAVGEGETCQIGDCPSTACFCGWLPTFFPDVFKSENKTNSRTGAVRFDYPEIVGYSGPVCGSSQEYLSFYSDFFGLDYNHLSTMIRAGYQPSYLDSTGLTDHEAVVQFLTDELEKHGYQVS